MYRVLNHAFEIGPTRMPTVEDDLIPHLTLDRVTASRNSHTFPVVAWGTTNDYNKHLSSFSSYRTTLSLTVMSSGDDTDSTRESSPSLSNESSFSGSTDCGIKADPSPSYQYTDYGQVPDEDTRKLLEHPLVAPPNCNASNEASILSQKFPVKLYSILARQEFQHIIAWLPHGRSWKILKPVLFELIVMPLYFEYSNYHSFNRLVNAWSFRRIRSGSDRGSYYNEVRKHYCLSGITQGPNYAHTSLSGSFSSFFAANRTCKSTCGAYRSRRRRFPRRNAMSLTFTRLIRPVHCQY